MRISGFLTAVATAVAAVCDGIQTLASVADQQRDVGGGRVDLCRTCLEFSNQAINELLNVVLNAGVIVTCGEVCSLVEQKTQKRWVGAACSILCDVSGVKAFTYLIDKVDVDPIYYCEIIKLCPIKDDGDAAIISITVTPAEGKRGTTFQLDLVWSSVNGTGIGEKYVSVATVDGIPLGDSSLNEMHGPGTYKSEITISTNDDPSCHPTKGPCEQWLPGQYPVTIAICNGKCGSKHPHSQVYDQQTATFTISG